MLHNLRIFKMKIYINEIEKIDLSRYKNLDNIDHNETLIKNL